MAETLNRLEADASWRRVRDRLRGELGTTTFERWMEAVELGSVAEGRVELCVPTRFLRDWVAPRYGDRLRALWQDESEGVATVDIVVRSGMPTSGDLPRPSAPPSDAETAGDDPFGDIDSIGAALDSRYCFENFVVGKPNEFAHAAAKRVGDSDDVPFNPLFIYGGVGLGKTHLMHAIGLQVRERRPDKRVIYLSAEKFMYQFIRALRFKKIMGFKELFRSADVLLIDDVQFIGGKESTQEEFFHTFNALIDQNKQVIVSGDRSPADL
ncbi:MAG TPA: DnaA/Hda family protein, partial [Alphaproteobacteria bacterium]|nr:DnaA/Hda family protein [Alphaproteobacteria bacterium]